MNKRDALKLRPGDRIGYGGSMWSAEVIRWDWGTVLGVTSRGGIQVKRDNGGVEWVPYHHVHPGMIKRATGVIDFFPKV